MGTVERRSWKSSESIEGLHRGAKDDTGVEQECGEVLVLQQ